MASTWVLIADSGGARIFTAEAPDGPLREIESIVHPEGRMPARELTSDLPGRAFDSAGHGRHAMESEVGPRKQAAIDFAVLLADRMERARVQGETERFVIAAAPEFLGLLRKSMSDHTRAMVAFELARDLVKLPPQEIRAHLPERLYSEVA